MEIIINLKLFVIYFSIYIRGYENDIIITFSLGVHTKYIKRKFITTY